MPEREQTVNAALGLAGEAGEVVDQIKKETFHNKPRNATKVLDECSDVAYYLVRILDLYGFTLEDAFKFNIEKLKERYPEGWPHG